MHSGIGAYAAAEEGEQDEGFLGDAPLVGAGAFFVGSVDQECDYVYDDKADCNVSLIHGASFFCYVWDYFLCNKIRDYIGSYAMLLLHFQHSCMNGQYRL